MLPVVGGKVGG